MKKIYIPIFWRFTISIIVMVTLFGSTNLFFVETNIKSTLLHESEKRVRYIAKNLARQAVDPLLYGDYITLQILVNEIKLLDSSVAYAFILSENDKLVIHDFNEGIPNNLISSNSITKGQEENVIMLHPKNAEKGNIRDIAVPIFDGEVGTVRIGIYETQIREDSRRIINMLLLMIGIFLILGILGAFLLSLIITHPIKIISSFTEKLDMESLKQKQVTYKQLEIRPWGLFPKLFQTQDELNFLAEKFNNMVNRLIIAYKELEETYTKFVETEKLASIGMLAAGVAHEINNPIAGLQSSIRMIKKHPENYIRNEKYINMMSEATDKIEIVVRTLLDYSRIHDVYDEKIQMIEVIEKALFLVEYRTTKYQINLINNGSSDYPKIIGSRNQLEQVFVNIFMNSIDAVLTKFESDGNSTKEIAINFKTSENQLLVIITDSGNGMDKDTLGKIFVPFFTTKEVGKGTGLGLYVCNNIINSHGGEITVESNLSIGTKFIIKLPFNKI